MSGHCGGVGPPETKEETARRGRGGDVRALATHSGFLPLIGTAG
jgi:hypothetical protein